MNTSNLSYPIYRSLFLAISFFTSSACLAERGGGYHQDVENHLGGGYNQSGGYNPDDSYRPNYGYHQDDEELNYYTAPSIGNYTPGSGWESPTIVFPGNDNDNCQNIQQCNSNGNCITTQTCD